MTDTLQYPWTPKPWKVEEKKTESPDSQFLNISTMRDGEKLMVGFVFEDKKYEEQSGLSASADAMLIALAPEMAEAILKLKEFSEQKFDALYQYEKGYESGIEDACEFVYELANKLNKIIEESE